jgi:hypothetical protein
MWFAVIDRFTVVIKPYMLRMLTVYEIFINFIFYLNIHPDLDLSIVRTP